MIVSTTAQTRMFVLEPYQLARLLWGVGAYAIRFYCTNKDWHCRYCGVLNNLSNFCVGCQAPKPASEKYGQMSISLYLPEGAWFANLKDGFELSIVLGKCERPDIFCPENTILYMQNCSIVQKAIPKLIAQTAEEVEHIMIYLTVVGDIHLVESIDATI